MAETKRLPRYEMDVSCGAFCQGGSVYSTRTDDTYPEVHDWRERGEWCKAEDVARLEDSHAELMDVVDKLSGLVGPASCGGNKCRLPHCEDCNEDPEDWWAVQKAVFDALARAREEAARD